MASRELALIPTMLIVEVWANTPFVYMILLAGILSVPENLYEAAKIDGASSIRMFFHITLPHIKPLIVIALFFRLIFSLRAFTTFFLMLGPQGGPASSAITLSLYLTYTTWKVLDMGGGMAVSYIIMLISIIIGISPGNCVSALFGILKWICCCSINDSSATIKSARLRGNRY